MGVINRFSHSVDRVNHCIGAASSWLIPAMALVTFTIVILRYGFSVALSLPGACPLPALSCFSFWRFFHLVG